MEIKLVAEVYRIGISIGFLTIKGMIKWADTIIDNLDSPPYEIIELSLSTKEKQDEICLKLMMVKGEIDNSLPPKIILGLLSEYLNATKDISSVISMLDKLIKYLPISNEWIELEIHFLSDGFYLAEQGIGDIEEVFNNLKKFLNQFVDNNKYLLMLFN
ncbi:hypothetical protein [Neobacillus sp. YIM B06451]|uniref:hypothetical protein n=1 Tax=Neobacillus sp. YIM B06451 TaxID=3070994 RepID=UPI002931C581|nr:hypothetical protein [Neobacillus sp. YIM B06451]